MRDARLGELLRDPAAHPASPLEERALRAAGESAIARFAAESSPRRRPSALRVLEKASLPLAAAALLLAASGWLGELWSAASTKLAAAEGAALADGSSWFAGAAEAMNAQPWLVATLAAGLAMLWLPPVRAALLGERD